MNKTPCDTCDFVTIESRDKPDYLWTCIKFPRTAPPSYVSEEYMHQQERYMRCNGINGGSCPLWEPRRDGTIEKGKGA